MDAAHGGERISKGHVLLGLAVGYVANGIGLAAGMRVGVAIVPARAEMEGILFLVAGLLFGVGVGAALGALVMRRLLRFGWNETFLATGLNVLLSPLALGLAGALGWGIVR